MSMTTAIMKITDNIYKAVELNQIAALMTVDKSAAFDNVSHQILLDKLSLYNVDPETVKLFRS